MEKRKEEKMEKDEKAASTKTERIKIQRKIRKKRELTCIEVNLHADGKIRSNNSAEAHSSAIILRRGRNEKGTDRLRDSKTE